MTLFRKFLVLATILALPVYLIAAEADSVKEEPPIQTLIPAGDVRSGFFAGPVIKAGAIDGQSAVLFGVRGGWVINRTFIVGVGGYGLANMMYQTRNASADTSVSLGYGGLELEYLLSSSNVVHATFMTLIGAGGFMVNRLGGSNNNYNMFHRTTFFIFEPAVNVEVNILTWLRVSVGAGYRMVTGIDATVGNRVYNNSTISGLFGAGTIKFGPY